MANLIAAAILSGVLWAAMRIILKETPEERAARDRTRAYKPIQKNPISNEALTNIIRLECNKGSLD